MKKITVFCLGILLLTGCHAVATQNQDLMANTSENEAIITSEKAKEIALNNESGEVVKAKIEYDDGIKYYEIDIVRDFIKYKFEIDTKGTILSKKQETIEHSNTNDNSTDPITLEQAKQIALSDEGGELIKAEIQEDDGYVYYEIVLIRYSVRYEYKIDEHGNILSKEQEQITVGLIIQ